MKNEYVRSFILVLRNLNLLDWLPDREYLKIVYWARFNKRLNLCNPQSYSEKLQWLKLNDHNLLYRNCVDKYDAKEYVSRRIGDKYIIPTLGVWDSFDDIDFSKLPAQFVLKCTHDSGGLVICSDKDSFNVSEAKKKINSCLKHNFFFHGREWPYKDLKPRVIAEKYMLDSKTNELKDYKFFCFDGEVKALFIASDRQKQTETKFDFFDADFAPLPIKNGHPNSSVLPEKPKCFLEMKDIAKKLSSGFPHVRVDLYEIDGQVFFGEMTFFHWSGLTPFEPEEWDYKFGSWLELPSK